MGFVGIVNDSNFCVKYDRRKDSDYDREQRIERIYKDRKLSGKMLCEGVIDKSSDGRKREAWV